MKKLDLLALEVISKIPEQTRKPRQKLPSPKRTMQFVNLSGELIEKPFNPTKDLSFMSRLLVMVNLPYRDPGIEARNWWRVNGSVIINVTPGYKKDKSIGIPYGSYPRLIMAYLITQAVKTRSPILNLGNSFKEFLDLIGIEKGGKQYHYLKKQLDRTLTASFSWTYENEKMWSRENIQVSHKSQLWWDPKSPDQLSFFDSYIKLNTDFFNEVIHRPVPIDLRVLKVLKNSPLGLDLYMFLSWRAFELKEPVFISWKTLHNQLGGQYTDMKNFARESKKHIKRIQAIWPELSVKSVRGRLCIEPSKGLISSMTPEV